MLVVTGCVGRAPGKTMMEPVCVEHPLAALPPIQLMLLFSDPIQ